MVILDTNHFSELERQSEIGRRLDERIRQDRMDSYVTIVTVEEVMRGWLARMNSFRDRGLSAYGRFHDGVEMIGKWTILRWDEEAADIFDPLKSVGVRIGTLDLRIASIALAYDATVLTRNIGTSGRCLARNLRTGWIDISRVIPPH